jgi:hypothetical protein
MARLRLRKASNGDSKKDILTRIVDEWDPLVESVNDIKSQAGLDVEDGSNLKKPTQEEVVASLANSIKMESALRESDDEDQAFMSFVKHMGK